MEKWARMNYQPNKPLGKDTPVTASPSHIALSREAATEGMVLLKNNKNTLPLAAGSRIAIFGKGSFDYVKGGGGSGDVYCPYIHNLYDGLKATGKVSIFEALSDFYRDNVSKQYLEGAAPGMTKEPELPEDLLLQASAFADKAILCISRFSGEGWDRSSVEYEGEFNPWETETSMPKLSGKIFPEGDFYLTKEEKALFDKVASAFADIIVVLNIGGIIDVSPFKDSDSVASILLAWQAGMEGGDAMAEILCGKSPSGKLVDTFAARVEDYPSTANFHESPHFVNYSEDIYVGYRYFATIPGKKEAVVYPFGYGLSYTSFKYSIDSCYEKIAEAIIEVQVTVTNTGKVAGKEVLQLYYSAPCGKLGKEAIALGDFAKTRLLSPGESMAMLLSIPVEAMASFDDLGKIKKSAYVLEAGSYHFFVGTSSVDLTQTNYSYELKEDKICKELQSLCSPSQLPERLLADGSMEALPCGKPSKACEDIFGYHDGPENLLDNGILVPNPNYSAIGKPEAGTEEAMVPGQRGYDAYMMLHPFGHDHSTLRDVYEGKLSLDDFMALLSDEDLMTLCSGQPNTGVANTWGFGNLPEFGVPSIMTADGPAGLRLNPVCGIYTTAWPCATLLASTWNPSLIESIGAAAGAEVKENNIAIWLAPAINIHRNPLCGRNFEYYSEDPLLTGKIGAAMVRGIQSNHVAACVKHFAVNNKETNRKHSDSRVSERALREIYLKAFEIIVKEAMPWSIMSSYNMVNGHRASENRDLLTGILREEWGFTGAVTTDWWTRGEHYKEILAGNDVKMACGYPERIKEAMKKDAVSRDDIASCAKRILELILKLD